MECQFGKVVQVIMSCVNVHCHCATIKQSDQYSAPSTAQFGGIYMTYNELAILAIYIRDIDQ